MTTTIEFQFKATTTTTFIFFQNFLYITLTTVTTTAISKTISQFSPTFFPESQDIFPCHLTPISKSRRIFPVAILAS